jgi:hypothetical protein
MTSTKLKASFNISAPILHRFNAVVACGERSRAVEMLMMQAALSHEADLHHRAEVFLSDPAFAQCREDAAHWNAMLGGHPKVV